MNPNDFQSHRTDEVPGEYDAKSAQLKSVYKDAFCLVCHRQLNDDNYCCGSNLSGRVHGHCDLCCPNHAVKSYILTDGIHTYDSRTMTGHEYNQALELIREITDNNLWWEEDRPLPIPDFGDNGPVFAISDDGAEFLAAIEYLEKNPDRPYQYRGWQISSHGFYQAWKKDFYLRCIIARNLVTAIYTLEMNGVTEPATDDEVEVPQ